MKLFLSILFTAVSITCFSQNYTNEISKIETQIKEAVANEDFEGAAKLKKQKALYFELEAAIKAENFEKAKEIKEKLTSKKEGATNKDCIVYFYSGAYIGSIGGYIMTSDQPNIELKTGSVKAIKLNAGIRTLTTNKFEIQDELTRNLEPGKMYFVEFNKEYGINIGYNPTIKFVTKETFIRNADYKEELDASYEVADQPSIPGKAKLFFYLDEKASANTSLEANGALLINKFDYKAKKYKYSISLAKGEKILTLVHQTVGKNPLMIKAVVRQDHVNLTFDEPIYMIANYRFTNVIFTEVTKEEFEAIKAEQINL